MKMLLINGGATGQTAKSTSEQETLLSAGGLRLNNPSVSKSVRLHIKTVISSICLSYYPLVSIS